MNPPPNFNYSLFNYPYYDPRPSFIAYSQPIEPTYHEEHEPQDYTVLPKISYDSFIGSPLEVTRQSTDATDASDHTPLLHQKGISSSGIPHPKYNMRDYNSTFGNFHPKPIDLAPKNKFIAVLGANTGISYKGFKTNLESKPYEEPSTLVPEKKSDSIKMEELLDKKQSADSQSHYEDGEEEHGHEIIMNAQLRSLLESKIWSAEKDQQLLKLGAQYKCDWKKISKRFNMKKITPHFLKIRYKELTCAPLQRRVKFNHREDLMIAKYFEKYGSNWAQMATHFKNRTAIMLKNRYYSFIRKRELLDMLLEKVKEIEKGDTLVDDMKDQESETCLETFLAQKGISCKMDPEDGSENAYYEMESSASNENNNKGNAEPNQDKHPIFGYERTYEGGLNKPENPRPMIVPMRVESLQSTGIGSEKNSKESDREAKEITILKARVKSLQMLYLRAKADLNKYKGGI